MLENVITTVNVSDKPCDITRTTSTPSQQLSLIGTMKTQGTNPEDPSVQRKKRYRIPISDQLTSKWLNGAKDSFRTVKSEESWGDRVLTSKMTSRGALTSIREVIGEITLDSFHKRIAAEVKSTKALARVVSRVRGNDRKFTEVCLRGSGIDDLDAMKLAIALRDNTTVSSIDLGNCNLTSAGMISLFKTLRKNSTVRTLSLDGNRIGRKGAKAAADALRGSKLALRSLNLSGNKIGVDGARFLAVSLSSPDVCTLEHLDLGMNRIENEGAKEIALALYTNNKLKKLSLNGNGFGTDPAKMLATALNHNETLRSLNIRANPIGEEAVKSFACVIFQKGNLVDLGFDLDYTPPVLLNEINSCLRHNSFRLEEREMRVLTDRTEYGLERDIKDLTAARKGQMEQKKSKKMSTIEKMDQFLNKVHMKS